MRFDSKLVSQLFSIWLVHLTNPVPLKTQFTGINRPDFTMEYATVLRMLGRERAIVVSGADGMDEASLAGQNSFVLLDKGDLIPFSLTAEDVGLTSAPASAIRGGDAKENAAIIRSIFQGATRSLFRYGCFQCRNWIVCEWASWNDSRRR